MDIARLRKKLREEKEKKKKEKRSEPGKPQGPIKEAETETKIEKPVEIPAQSKEEQPEQKIASEESALLQREPSAEEPVSEEELGEQEEEFAEEEQFPYEKPVEQAAAGAESIVTKDEKEQEDTVEILIFQLMDELYAFRVTDVVEVLRSQKITKVPRVVEFVYGITSLRGTIMPVMDLKRRIHISDGNENGKNIIILRSARGLIGTIVDRTLDVAIVDSSSIMNAPSHLGDLESRFIEGVVSREDRFVSIINPQELLTFEAMGGVDGQEA